MVTDRVELTTFAPVHLVHLGDQIMIGFVFAALFSNAFNMYRGVMKDTKIPLHLYLTEAPVFFLNYFTQKRWRKCGTGPGSAWWRHLFLFSGWVSMEILVMAYLSEFQTDIVHPFWHWTRLLGYYGTIALMVGSTMMLYSRWFKKEENLHRYSDFTDIFFLVLIATIATTGIMVHFSRLAGLPIMTYVIYVIHVAICVGMLCIMIPVRETLASVLPAVGNLPHYPETKGPAGIPGQPGSGSQRRGRHLPELYAVRGLHRRLSLERN